MSVALYMDVHVPAAITRGLLLRNVDVLTAQMDGATELEDPDLLDRATELGRVMVSRMKICSLKHHGVNGVEITLLAFSTHTNLELRSANSSTIWKCLPSAVNQEITPTASSICLSEPTAVEETVPNNDSLRVGSSCA